jgi:hypothetical protein
MSGRPASPLCTVVKFSCPYQTKKTVSNCFYIATASAIEIKKLQKKQKMMKQKHKLLPNVEQREKN